MFIQVFSSGIYGLLLFARIWSGLGAGALTVTTPMYLSEIGVFSSQHTLALHLLTYVLLAPTRTRGLVVSVYMVILLAILALGKASLLFLFYLFPLVTLATRATSHPYFPASHCYSDSNRINC